MGNTALLSLHAYLDCIGRASPRSRRECGHGQIGADNSRCSNLACSVGPSFALPESIYVLLYFSRLPSFLRSSLLRYFTALTSRCREQSRRRWCRSPRGRGPCSGEPRTDSPPAVQPTTPRTQTNTTARTHTERVSRRTNSKSQAGFVGKNERNTRFVFYRSRLLNELIMCPF